MSGAAGASLADLVRLLRQAEGPDRALDHLVAWHLAPEHWRRVQDGRMEVLHMGLNPPRWVAHDDPNVMPARYTGSLDAALLTVPIGASWIVDSDGFAGVSDAEDGDGLFSQRDGATSVLSLCIAGLYARLPAVGACLDCGARCNEANSWPVHDPADPGPLRGYYCDDCMAAGPTPAGNDACVPAVGQCDA